jgi:hypothetical protein
VTLEEIQGKSKKDLRRMINQRFERSIEATNESRAGIIAEAEFLMRELDRRNDSWVSVRDFILEIIVIALIGWEIHMSYRAEHLQSSNAKEEGQILTHLADSSRATSDILTALSKTTDIMANAVQEQLGLNYEVMLESHFDKEKKAISITNDSRTTVYMWGFKQDDEPQIVYSKGGPFLPGVPQSISLERNLKKARTPDNYNAVVYSFGILLKNKPGEEFVGRFRVVVSLTDGGMGATPISVTRERWSGKEVVLPKSPLIKP